MLEKFDPLTPNGLTQLKKYKKLTYIFGIAILFLVGTMIWYYKVHPCMTDWKIAEYLQEHRQ